MTSRLRLLLSLASTVFVMYLASGPLMRKALGDTGYTQLAIFHEVVSKIRDAYVDPVNMDRTLDAAEKGLLEALDGDSGALDAEDFKLAQTPAKAVAETGIVLGRRFGFLTVVATRPGSPARRAGVKAGDFIKTIDGRHTHNITVFRGERMLEGAPGTTVRVGIFKSGAEAVETSMTREPRASVAPVTRLLDGGVGYLAAPDVSDDVAPAIRAGVASLEAQGARAIVLDLRSSASGPLKNAVALVQPFTAGGVVARLVSRTAPEAPLQAPANSAFFQGPLTVLVDRGTAGAAEIAAACLLESNRATLVGEGTFGRAGVQKPVPLESGGGLLLTVSRYLTPKGQAINGKGLTPKTLVRNPEAPESFGVPGKDPVLDKALESLKAAGLKAAA